MRTWSVSGTAFALWIRSSSLSIRTRTSISPPSLLLRAQRGAGPTLRKHLAEAFRNHRRHEFVDLAAEGGDLLYAARGDEAVQRARHHVERLHLRCEDPVQVVHLKLPLEVGDHAKALDHRLRAPAPGKVDDQLGEDVHLHVVEAPDRFVQEADALLDREHRRLVVRVADDADDDAVEDPGRARDHVDVAVRDRVITAWTVGPAHARANTV